MSATTKPHGRPFSLILLITICTSMIHNSFFTFDFPSSLPSCGQLNCPSMIDLVRGTMFRIVIEYGIIQLLLQL